MSPAPLSITRKLEFDAGHRIPNHASKCRNLHGHRYVLECTVTGPLISQAGDSSEGMIVDFGVLKEVMNNTIVNVWDHALLLWIKDPILDGVGLLEVLGPDHKTVLLPCIPTVERLAEYAFSRIEEALLSYGLTLTHLRLYETPNCWADQYTAS